MQREFKTAFISFLVFIGLFSCCLAMGGKAFFLPAKAANFELFDTKGNIIKFSDYKGKVVLLNFFATWCPPCRAEMPSIQELYSKIEIWKDIKILAVSVDRDSKEKVISFIDNGGYQFKVLLDPNSAAAEKYNVSAIPVTFIINKKGMIVAKEIGGRDWAEPEIIDKLKKLSIQ